MILDQIIEAGLKPPKTLTLSITNGCNLRCLHCLPDSGAGSLSGPVSKETLSRLMEELARTGIETITIAGGEPLTHPDWLEIMARACGLPGVRNVCLQTNATLLREVEARQLVSLEYTGLSVQVSLDGARAESHEKVRGKGSYERALGGLRHLAARGLGERTRVAFTEMRHNFDELPALLEIIENLGLKGLVTGTLLQQGRAAKTDKLAPPAPSQYERLLDLYHSDSVFRNRYEKMGNIAAVEWHKAKEAVAGECVCSCIENLYITADGRLYPCTLFQADELVVKNVYERPLQEVFEEALSRWSRLPEMRRTRSLELEACRTCPGRRHCGGGCMGRAHAAHGSVMSVEDRCSLRRAVYSYQYGS